MRGSQLLMLRRWVKSLWRCVGAFGGGRVAAGRESEKKIYILTCATGPTTTGLLKCSESFDSIPENFWNISRTVCFLGSAVAH